MFYIAYLIILDGQNIKETSFVKFPLLSLPDWGTE